MDGGNTTKSSFFSDPVAVVYGIFFETRIIEFQFHTINGIPSHMLPHMHNADANNSLAFKMSSHHPSSFSFTTLISISQQVLHFQSFVSIVINSISTIFSNLD